MSDDELKKELLSYITKQYPKVATIMETYWNEPDFNEAVNKLMLDSRDGRRKGFPMDITHAIFDLVKLHDNETGKTGWQDNRRTPYFDGHR